MDVCGRKLAWEAGRTCAFTCTRPSTGHAFCLLYIVPLPNMCVLLHLPGGCVLTCALSLTWCVFMLSVHCSVLLPPPSSVMHTCLHTALPKSMEAGAGRQAPASGVGDMLLHTHLMDYGQVVRAWASMEMMHALLHTGLLPCIQVPPVPLPATHPILLSRQAFPRTLPIATSVVSLSVLCFSLLIILLHCLPLFCMGEAGMGTGGSVEAGILMSELWEGKKATVPALLHTLFNCSIYHCHCY